MGKGSSWLYIGSIGLVIAAIAITAVIDRSRSGQEDIRAKAGVVGGTAASSIVSSLDESAGALLVTNFVIGSSGAGDASQIWTIELPTNANTALFAPGVRVNLKLDPTSVNISAYTARALEVTTR